MTQGFDEWLLNENDKLEFLNLPVVKNNLASCWFDDQKLIMPSGQGRTLKAAVYSALEVFKIVKASRQAEVDELQKQIDDSLDYVFGLYCTGDLDTERLENILKGESNE